MPDRAVVVEVLHAISAAMEEMEAPWYVFGAQAAIIWGSPRLSADVDVTINTPLPDPTRLVECMRSHDFSLAVDDPAFIERTRVVPFVHRTSGMPVDVVLGGSGLEDEFARRARLIDISGRPIPVIAPEDLIITKILAGRPKDVEDIRAVLGAQRDLDLERIRSVLRLLEEALAMSDLVRAFEAEVARP